MPKLNVESFNLDHRQVVAPYIRVADVKQLPHGDVLTKYDVRFCQPNVDHLTMPAIHSIEHMFAEKVRDYSDVVIDFSPMGCQTGFYLMMAEPPDVPVIAKLIEKTFADILHADEVPAANEQQCGWGANHSLEQAQDAVRAMLAKRASWESVNS